MSFGRVAIPGWHKSATRAPSAVQAAATQLSREDSSFAGKTKRLRGCRFSQGRRHSTAAPSGTSGVKEETASGRHDVLGSLSSMFSSFYNSVTLEESRVARLGEPGGLSRLRGKD